MVTEKLAKGRKTTTSILPLESGDRLTRSEFERRYQAMPHLNKAELVEGVVYVSSPVRATSHGEPHSYLMMWVAMYAVATPGVHPHDNTTVRLDVDNEPQPDALLRLDEHLGGTSRISADDYIEGAPEFIGEIAASSAAYDVHDKLRAYRRNRVQEYLVWRVHDQRLDWWQWQDGVYEPLAADAQGMVRSVVFPGLWLHIPALLNGNLAEVVSTLQMGLASPEHEAFAARLQAGNPAR
ncbi:MAG: Uma2 family endonuclease [Candidatus Tectomicrobia bacterium]|nr:Uma2 family endonuclease [Candidatus Tectomicrobia bacterium]